MGNDYRVCCDRCKLITGTMTEQMADSAAKAHADATGHNTIVATDWRVYP